MMKKDIGSREDIVKLVDTFYERVRRNKTIGPIFNDVAKVNWEAHMPRMYDFWSGMLLGDNSYTGNPMTPHIQLSKRTPMTDTEFSEWLSLFTDTVDDLFEGEIAQEAKTRAENIARLMMFKIQTA